MTTVIYHPGKEIPRRRAPMGYGGFIILEQGRNNVIPEIVDRLKSLPGFKRKVEEGIIEFLNIDVDETTGEVDFSTAKADDAYRLIALEASIDTLKKWSEIEAKTKKRVTVLNAIHSQINRIKTGAL